VLEHLFVERQVRHDLLQPFYCPLGSIWSRASNFIYDLREFHFNDRQISLYDRQISFNDRTHNHHCGFGHKV